MLKSLNAKLIAIVGVIGILIATSLLIQTNKVQADPVTTAGNWSDYADGDWLNIDLPRYDGYETTPGSSAEFPYLIETPAEFAYLGTVGQTGQFAGQYIKLSRGCNCDEPLTEMDFSAHYWDPVYLYGGAYGSMYDETVAAHIDGNSVQLKGIKINRYAKANYAVVVCNEGYVSNNCYDASYTPPGDESGYLGDYDSESNVLSDGASGAGLFGELYKARVANFNLIAPEIITTAASNIAEELTHYDDPIIRREEAVGSLVGSSRRTRILDSQVTSPNIQLNEPYLGQVFMLGGLVGYNSGYVYAINDHVGGGSVKLSPHYPRNLAEFQEVNDKLLNYGQFLDKYGGDFDDYGDYMSQISDLSTLYFNNLPIIGAQGGLIGMNYHSVVMNSSATTKLKFDLSGLSYDERDDEQAYVDNMTAGYLICDENNPEADCYYDMDNLFFNIYDYTHNDIYIEPARPTGGMGIGGLIGISSDNTPIEACVFNSYANGDIDLVGETITQTDGSSSMDYGSGPAVGGLIGAVNDVVINNYATLKINIASLNGSFDWYENTIGVLFGAMDDENHQPVEDDDICTGWDEYDCVDFDEYWDSLQNYAITDNYYPADSTYPAIGDDLGANWEYGRQYDVHYQECDAVDPTNCWWDSREETKYYAETFDSQSSLLARLNSGLGDVERAVRGHLVSSNLLPPALADWWASKISPWALDSAGYSVLESQLSLFQTQPENDCLWSKLPPPAIQYPQLVPGAPNTGQRR